MRIRLAAAALALVAFVTAPPASAEIFEGDPVHGTDMDMWTDARGRVSKMLFSFGGRCRKFNDEDDYPAEYTGGGRTTLRPPRRSNRRFTVVKAYRQEFREGHWLRIRIRMHGTRQGRKRWSGRYSAVVRVYRDGRRIDVCRNPVKTWKARRIPRWRLETTGDFAFRISQPAIRAYAYGDDDFVAFAAHPWPDGLDSWSGEFKAPEGETLQPGRTYRSEWSVDGFGTRCEVTAGEFTLHEREWVRPNLFLRGFSNEIRRLRVSFVLFCGTEAAARGTFDYAL